MLNKTDSQLRSSPPKGKNSSYKKKILGLVILVAVVAGGWALLNKGNIQGTEVVEIQGVSPDTVVATVNGKDIKLADVKRFASTIPQLSELPFEMVYPQLLETMVNSRVLLIAAEKANVEKDEEVKRNLRLAQEQILSQSYLAKQLQAQITPEKLKTLYDEELKTYTPQEEVRARHILVGSQKEAQDILIQLKAGADFSTLANTKSLDAENKDGELGYFTKNMMIPEFGDAVFALKKGELSSPIKTPFGWHIVLVEDKRLASPPAIEDVQDQLKQAFMEKNARSVIQQERDKMKVVIYKPTLSNKKAPTSAPMAEESVAPDAEETTVSVSADDTEALEKKDSE